MIDGLGRTRQHLPLAVFDRVGTGFALGQVHCLKEADWGREGKELRGELGSASLALAWSFSKIVKYRRSSAKFSVAPFWG